MSRLNDGEDWGDHLRSSKPKHCLRLIGGNLNGLPIDELDPGGKMTDLCQTLKDLSVDVAAFTEPNLNPQKLKDAATWSNRLRRYKLKKVRSSWANNRTCPPPPTPQQYGGNLVISKGEMTSRVPPKQAGADADPTKLGRWSSLVFAGTGTHKLRVVSAYMPSGKDARGKDT